MAWGKAGSKTLDSTDDAISVTAMSANDTFQSMSHIITSSTFGVYDRYNDVSSGNLYHGRYETNGTTDQLFNANAIYSMLDNSGGTGMSAGDYFNVSYTLNVPTEEKLVIGSSNMASGTGAGTAPKRNQYVAKFANTSDQITSVSKTNVSAGDYLTDSNLTVLGSDMTTTVGKPTNVQVGSRFEETDTRKMYHYNLTGDVTTDGSYTVLKYRSDGTFTPTSAFNVEYLVVAGGGGGGGANAGMGGGGGAGGFRTNLGGTALGVTAQSYPITVGDGGSGGTSGSTNGGTIGVIGGNSTFSTITSNGGGGGGQYLNKSPSNGGSGGGAGHSSTSVAGGTGISGQGNAGGAGVTGMSSGSGGGGKGAVGTQGSSWNGGAGGNGSSSNITGSSIDYAGGGGGATHAYAGSGTGALGGSGGGGKGASISGNPSTSGTPNTGGGGGGGNDFPYSASAGGSGIVIIRFLTSGNTYTTSLSSNEWTEEGT
jgi:hypothetical protein